MGGAPLPHPAPAPTLQLRGRQGPALSRPRWPCHALLRRHPHRTHDPLRGDSFMLPLGWQIHVATTPPAPLGRASVSAPERRTRQATLPISRKRVSRVESLRRESGARLQTKGSRVRISPGAPFLIFCPCKDQIERLSVSGIDTCGVYRAVRKDDSE